MGEEAIETSALIIVGIIIAVKLFSVVYLRIKRKKGQDGLPLH